VSRQDPAAVLAANAIAERFVGSISRDLRRRARTGGHRGARSRSTGKGDGAGGSIADVLLLENAGSGVLTQNLSRDVENVSQIGAHDVADRCAVSPAYVLVGLRPRQLVERPLDRCRGRRRILAPAAGLAPPRAQPRRPRPR